MMGNWLDIRSNGRLMARLDAERRLLEIVRNGEMLLIDLDVFLDAPTAQGGEKPAAPPGPQEFKGG